MRCWHGYLSGTRCRWFAYGPADATASSLASLNGLVFLVPAYPGCPGKEAIKQAWFMFVPLLFIYDGTWLYTCEETCIDAYQVANPELSSSERHTQSTERRFTVLSCAELLEPVVSLTDIDDDDWTSYCRKSESAARTWRCDRYCNNGICGSSINYACLSCLSNLPWPVYMPSILHCVTVWFLSYNYLFFCCHICACTSSPCKRLDFWRTSQMHNILPAMKAPNICGVS